MRSLIIPFAVMFASFGVVRAQEHRPQKAKIPADIAAIFNKPLYQGAIWGLRVVDLDSGKELIDLHPEQQFYIGSVRKVFTIGELLNEIGPDYRYNTPVYYRGSVDSAGVLHGDLILVASGDLTMGGRTKPDGTIAFSSFDHNEADSIGNAVLTKPNPLAGYFDLAKQVATAGIKEITGEVIIDDRLFQPFNFRGEFDVRPIFVNDDVVDVIIRPGSVGDLAAVKWRPVSAALGIDNRLLTSGPQSEYTLKLNPTLPQCIGQPDCLTEITGELPADFSPPLTGQYPLVQTVRIVQPSNYARTILIEALRKEGVRVDAPLTAENPVSLLPPANSYPRESRLAELKGMPYSEDAKLILKVSYNIGADTSLVLFGLTQGLNNMHDALRLERENLRRNYGIPAHQYHFVDGSGGGETTAKNRAVTRMLEDLAERPTFPVFFRGLPALGVDGTLASVTDFEADPTLAGAKGQVRAKTGTYVGESDSRLLLKGQSYGGYIHTQSGKRLVYELVVNNVPISSVADVFTVFEDQGTISAMLWRDN